MQSEMTAWQKGFRMPVMKMGITTHLNIGVAKGESTHAIVETFVDYQVITNSICFAEPRQLFVKRVMDIAGGIRRACTHCPAYADIWTDYLFPEPGTDLLLPGESGKKRA